MELMPEPPNGAHVKVDVEPREFVALRHDDGDDPATEARWYPLLGEQVDPLTWDEIHTPLVVDPATGQEWPRVRPVVRLYPQPEVDRLIAEAVAAGGFERIGDHVIGAATGLCTVHGERYELPHELERLREREGGRR